jgi:hypothetical protein
MTLLTLLFFIFLLVPLGQFSKALCDPSPQTLQSTAFTCLTDVYPIDLNYYNVTFGAFNTLSEHSDTFTTQVVDYKLNSPYSNLVANMLFRDNRLYSLNLRVVNGSVVTDRTHNLTDVAKDFLRKYQVLSGADSTDLIRLLDNFDEAKDATATLGNITLSVSHLIISNKANGTTYNWLYTLNDTATVSVSLTFDKGAFHSFYDDRQLYMASSSDAISAAMNYVQNHSYAMPEGTQVNVNEFNVDKASSVAEFFTFPRNDNALYPAWNVTLNLSQTYGGINALQLNVLVWADSCEVFNYSSNETVVLMQRSPTIVEVIATIAALTTVIAITIILLRK